MRQCHEPPCDGTSIQSRACNSHPCKVGSSEVDKQRSGQWSCWTDWSECSVSCGVGVRTRKRECLDSDTCEGPRLVREVCDMPSCESMRGWDIWSRWTPCDGDRQQHRKRQCLQIGNGMCRGSNREMRDCLPDCIENGIYYNCIVFFW